jgi:hypothetical protein
MTPHEDHADESAARGFLRTIILPNGWTLARVDRADEPDWDQAEEDREQGVGIRLDDPQLDPDEFVKRWPMPARSAESKYLPSGG